MPPVLSSIQQIIERSIYHAIRRKAVALGYTAEMTTSDTVGEAGREAYKAKVAAITLSKGFSIEIFGHSSSQEKGIKEIARIVIDPYGFVPGDIGNDPTPFYTKQSDGSFTKSEATSMFSNYSVNIYITGHTAEQVRILNGIMGVALGKRGYLPRYPAIVKSKSGNLFYEQLDQYDDTDVTEGVIEKIYRYNFPDLMEVDLQNPVVIATLKQIDLELKYQEKLLATLTVGQNDTNP